eukprot:CAMPEP_0113845714 /NCGR_PEP_ID=MMETSP0372-20130328/912_1 /TAXON_ID=340204 /ORGANISM="Lankesteria abbotti" /LENGTH=597 /DNA_ID=CAMNT_0000814791 /DNA_START=65 /DNA_END=1858 /DNA_ORIENTATION=+ /assembly_acc=CAM_ASM_000359
MFSTFRIKYTRNPPKDIECKRDGTPSETTPLSFLEVKKNKLSATDFSAQLWCEKQLELTILTGKRRETEAMRSGTARHEILENADHETVEVEVDTAEESLGFRLLNTCILLQKLLQEGKSRELWVFGVVENEILVRGIIDEVHIRRDPRNRNGELVLVDTKTRRQRTEPSAAQKRTSAMQLSIYQWIVGELRQGRGQFESLFRLYEVDPAMPFTHELLAPYSNLEGLAAQFQELFCRLPPLKKSMQIAYEHEGEEFCRADVEYNEAGFAYSFQDLLQWWSGQRPTEVLLQCEKWKCRFCDFVGNECTESPLDADEIEGILEKREIEKLAEEELTALTGGDIEDVSFSADCDKSPNKRVDVNENVDKTNIPNRDSQCGTVWKCKEVVSSLVNVKNSKREGECHSSLLAGGPRLQGRHNATESQRSDGGKWFSPVAISPLADCFQSRESQSPDFPVLEVLMPSEAQPKADNVKPLVKRRGTSSRNFPVKMKRERTTSALSMSTAKHCRFSKEQETFNLPSLRKESAAGKQAENAISGINREFLQETSQYENIAPLGSCNTRLQSLCPSTDAIRGRNNKNTTKRKQNNKKTQSRIQHFFR